MYLKLVRPTCEYAEQVMQYTMAHTLIGKLNGISDADFLLLEAIQSVNA